MVALGILFKSHFSTLFNAIHSDYKIVEVVNLFNFIRTLTLIHRNVKDFIAQNVFFRKCIQINL